MKHNDIELKKFFQFIYGSEIVTPGKFKDGQHVRVTDFTTTLYFNDVDELVAKSLSTFRGRNCYFELATTDGNGGARENLKKISVIGIDFDSKTQPQGFNHTDIIQRFNKLGLKYHAMVASGNGYHVYMAIEPTENIELVSEVTKALQIRLNSDEGATKTTQLLRVPFTLNCKEPSNKKPVNLLHIYPLSTVRRYGIESLASKFLTARNESRQAFNTINVIDNTNVPLCVKRIIEQGSEKGNRNADLQKIVVTLRQRNKVLSEIMKVVQEWAQKCKPVFDERLEYQVKHIYDRLKYAKLDCDGCTIKAECKTIIESEFNFDGELITMTESQARALKHNSRKGVKELDANGNCILGVLKCHSDGLTKAQIIEEMTYTDSKTKKTTIVMSEKTLKDAIRKLKNDGFIEATNDRTPVYTAHEPRTNIELTYKISFSATYEAIKGHISLEELRLYNYMRYLHNVEQRTNPTALKGNLFQVTQSELAKDFGVTQGRISQMINKLLAEKIISIWHKEKSRNNGFDFNIYRLNY